MDSKFGGAWARLGGGLDVGGGWEEAASVCCGNPGG